ncbi:hypothetical protein LshimejAT787_1801040 [Lyophyllum shimeji]|uniref:Uncharacterized protein n=1 Tax=Lyophyllum shimeji TaxID=47721 RepID=A0A9P3PXD3_LYOSH|nr:hypothetical protein LshimejAT787_1801040 [Lyophyllum shimeji]
MPPEKRQRASAATALCQFCQKPFSRQGLSTHEKACRKKKEAQQRDADVRPETVRKIAERLSKSADAQAEVARAALKSALSRDTCRRTVSYTLPAR